MIKRMDDVIEEVYVEGRFKVKVGNKVVARGRNKWTRYFASTIVEHVIHSQVNHGGPKYNDTHIFGIANNATARVGKDTTTPTDPSMTDLVQKEDVAPSSFNRVLEKNDAMTEYRSKYIFQWDTGVLPNMTIGEFGIYGLLGSDAWSSPLTNPNPYTYLPYNNRQTLSSEASTRLMARISSGDGDFTPIDYTNTKVLKLEWVVIVSG